MATFETIGGSFTLDRTGLFTSVQRYVFPGDDGSEAEKYAAGFEDSSFQADESGQFWIGEYRSTDAKGMITEELDFSCKEEPIQSHPNFWTNGGIAELYGYNESVKEFSINVPDQSLTSDIQTIRNNGAGGDNPMYGVTSFLSMTATFRKNQTVSDLGEIDGLFDNIGQIDDPDWELIAIPELDSRNWLRLAPKITSRAGIFEVSQQWMLSGPGGWNSLIYKPSS
jgi:hypothetical protein